MSTSLEVKFRKNISVVEPEPAPTGYFAGAGAVKKTGSSSGSSQS